MGFVLSCFEVRYRFRSIIGRAVFQGLRDAEYLHGLRANVAMPHATQTATAHTRHTSHAPDDLIGDPDLTSVVDFIGHCRQIEPRCQPAKTKLL